MGQIRSLCSAGGIIPLVVEDGADPSSRAYKARALPLSYSTLMRGSHFSAYCTPRSFGNPQRGAIKVLELVEGLEPSTIRLQGGFPTDWATPAYCPSFRAVNAALCQSFARFRTGGHLRFHFRMSPFFQEQQDSPWCLRPVHAPGGSIFAPGLSEGPSSVRSLGFSRLHSVLRYWYPVLADLYDGACVPTAGLEPATYWASPCLSSLLSYVGVCPSFRAVTDQIRDRPVSRPARSCAEQRHIPLSRWGRAYSLTFQLSLRKTVIRIGDLPPRWFYGTKNRGAPCWNCTNDIRLARSALVYLERITCAGREFHSARLEFEVIQHITLVH